MPSPKRSRQRRISDLLPASKPSINPAPLKRKRGRPRKNVSSPRKPSPAAPPPSSPPPSTPPSSRIVPVDTPNRGRRLNLPHLDTAFLPASSPPVSSPVYASSAAGVSSSHSPSRPSSSASTARPLLAKTNSSLSVSLSVAPDGCAALGGGPSHSPLDSLLPPLDAASSLSRRSNSPALLSASMPAQPETSHMYKSDLVPANVSGMGRVLLDRRVLQERLGNQGATAAILQASTFSDSQESSKAPQIVQYDLKEPMSSDLAAWLADGSDSEPDSPPLPSPEIDRTPSPVAPGSLSGKELAAMVQKRLDETVENGPDLSRRRSDRLAISNPLDGLSTQRTKKDFIACVCAGEGPSKDASLQCTKCDNWFHFICIELKASNTPRRWSCFRCTGGPLPRSILRHRQQDSNAESPLPHLGLFGSSDQEPTLFDAGQQTPRQDPSKFPTNLALAPSLSAQSTPKRQRLSNSIDSDNPLSSYHGTLVNSTSSVFTALGADYSPQSPIVTRQKFGESFVFPPNKSRKDGGPSSSGSSPRPPKFGQFRSHTAPNLLMDPYEEHSDDERNSKMHPRRKRLRQPSSPSSPSPSRVVRGHHRRSSSTLSGLFAFPNLENDSKQLQSGGNESTSTKIPASSSWTIPSTPSRCLSSAALGINTPGNFNADKDSSLRLRERRLSIDMFASPAVRLSYQHHGSTNTSVDVSNDTLHDIYEHDDKHHYDEPAIPRATTSAAATATGLAEPASIQSCPGASPLWASGPPGLGIDFRGGFRSAKNFFSGDAGDHEL